MDLKCSLNWTERNDIDNIELNMNQSWHDTLMTGSLWIHIWYSHSFNAKEFKGYKARYKASNMDILT